MTEEAFANLAVPILVGALVIYMGWIVWDLAKRSNAGRFGTAILFVVLGAGVGVFLLKSVLVEVLHF